MRNFRTPHRYESQILGGAMAEEYRQEYKDKLIVCVEFSELHDVTNVVS